MGPDGPTDHNAGVPDKVNCAVWHVSGPLIPATLVRDLLVVGTRSTEACTEIRT